MKIKYSGNEIEVEGDIVIELDNGKEMIIEEVDSGTLQITTMYGNDVLQAHFPKEDTIDLQVV